MSAIPNGCTGIISTRYDGGHDLWRVQLRAVAASRSQDGKRLWETFAATSGTEARGECLSDAHEDRYFIFSEKGDLIMATWLLDGYANFGRMHLIAPR